jgi:hypothetical protein
MANTHSQFMTFLDAIKLKEASKDSLRTSRDANRTRIKTHFKETLKRPVPTFCGQGSYTMNTGVEPLSGEDYDIDDGVYIQDLGTDMSTWPTADTVHGWIVDAVKGSTSETPKNKARCVRVRYQADYHVDLPIYAMDANDQPRLFEIGKSTPPISDPKKLREWWKNAVSGKPQLRRIVRYLKAWRDYKNAISSTASGLALTILAVNHYVEDEQDDIAFQKTVEAIYNHLNSGFSVAKPVEPYDVLSERWSSAQRSGLISQLKTLKDKGQEAIDKEKLSDATKLWRKQLGERFPEIEEEADEASRKTSAPAYVRGLGNDSGRSA